MTLRHRQTSSAQRQGFTLIELMVVLVVIGMIAAWAYPTYVEASHRARRLQAQQALLEASFYLQRFYAEHHRYDDELPTSLRQTPAQGRADYQLSVRSFGARFEIIAQRQGTMRDDRCGDFKLNHQGVKSLDGQPRGTVMECWP